MAILRYGADCSVRLEFADGVTPTECGTPRGPPLDNPAAALGEALRRPLEYPPLARSTTPGDRVVLALDRGVPRAAEVVAGVVEALLAAGVQADGISVLRTRADADAGSGDPCPLLPDRARRRITLLTHSPTDRHELAYLAATATGDPILLSRALHEADLVLPIGCLHGETAGGYFGIHTAVYPNFSDSATAGRFCSPGSLQADGVDRRRLVDEVDEVAWLLGINFTIQLVPAGGQSILHVLAGQSEAVRQRGRRLYDEAWTWPVPHPVALVVAAIEGDSSQQTWQGLGRALEAATSAVEDGGSIAVCCELAEAPGVAIQQLIGAPSRQAAMRRIRQGRPADALPAAQLARTLDRGKVYLLSRLDPAVVDALDMIHVAAPEELGRLVRQYESCILLSNASLAVVTVEQPVLG